AGIGQHQRAHHHGGRARIGIHSGGCQRPTLSQLQNSTPKETTPMNQTLRPSPALQRVINVLEYPSTLVARMGAWLIVPLMFSLVFEVVSRYIFNRPTIWAYDMTYMLSSAVFMLGAAFALQKGSHVRADF